MREIARQKCLIDFFFRVLPTPHSQGPKRFSSKRRNSAQRCAFLG